MSIHKAAFTKEVVTLTTACVSSTPFGNPVVPLVKYSWNPSSGE
jgi:hypothetical protein